MPKSKSRRKSQERKRFPNLAVLCNDPRCGVPHGSVSYKPPVAWTEAAAK